MEGKGNKILKKRENHSENVRCIIFVFDVLVNLHQLGIHKGEDLHILNFMDQLSALLGDRGRKGIYGRNGAKANNLADVLFLLSFVLVQARRRVFSLEKGSQRDKAEHTGL